MFGDLFAPTHLVIILAIALVVFGPARLPEIGRGLGQAIRGFKTGLDEGAVARPKLSGEVEEPRAAPLER